MPLAPSWVPVRGLLHAGSMDNQSLFLFPSQGTLRLEAYILKFLILSFIVVSLKVSFYFLIGLTVLSVHA